MIGGTSSQELTASATAIKPTPIKTARLDRRFRRRMPGPVNGDIVILAVYYPAVKDIIAQYADKLAGKIVVDITNPLNVETFDSLVVPADSSAAAELAAALPSSRVLKAFNTNFAATLGEKSVGPNPTTVLIAGDDVTPRLRSALRSGRAVWKRSTPEG
jgi:predicted dinucleotide-binding enzyme